MNKIVLVLFFILFQPLNLFGHEKSDLHQLCLEARDYLGCVETSASKTTTKTKRIIHEIDDWRQYGPIEINWSFWKTRRQYHIAPAINQNKQPIFIAINCNKYLLNTTGNNNQWKNWFSPSLDFELTLINDYCR